MTEDAGILFRPGEGQQTKFYQRTEREVFGGGAAGGGKSTLLRWYFMKQLRTEHSRYMQRELRVSQARCIYFRRTIPNLLQAVDLVRQQFPLIDPGFQWDVQNKRGTFTCGATWQAAGMENTKDYLKFKSSDFTMILFDELTEFEEEQYNYMETRLRSVDPELAPRVQVVSCSNPEGIGLDWVKRKFFDVARPETIVVRQIPLEDGSIREQTQIFIPFRLRDNPDPTMRSGDYEATLRKKHPKIWRPLLKGDWTYSTSALLTGIWDPEKHIIPRHKVPKGATIIRSCDYGNIAPASVSWWYINFDGMATCFHNLYGPAGTVKALAKKIIEVERYYGLWDKKKDQSKLTGCPLDDQCWASVGTRGPTIASEFTEYGIFWVKCTKDRMSGGNQILQRLDNTLTGDGPGIRWMDGGVCEAPIRLLPMLPPNPNNPEDVDPKAEIHVWDDTMYFCSSRPLTPDKDGPSPDDEEDEDEEAAAEMRRAQRRSGLVDVGFGYN